MRVTTINQKTKTATAINPDGLPIALIISKFKNPSHFGALSHGSEVLCERVAYDRWDRRVVKGIKRVN